MNELAAFWNQRYGSAEYVYGTEPNEFLVEQVARLQKSALDAPVLCLADGEGRNSVWLARQGFAVTAVDVAERGLAKAQALAARQGVTVTTRLADVTAFDLGQDHWGAIVSIFLHLPAALRSALHRRCLQALRPGGVYLFEAYGPEQLQYGTGGPKELQLLAGLAALQADFEPGSIVHAWSGVRRIVEGPLHTGDGHVNQLVIQKRSGDPP